MATCACSTSRRNREQRPNSRSKHRDDKEHGIARARLEWSPRGRRAVLGAAKYGVVKGYDAIVSLALLPLITRAMDVDEFARFALLGVAGNVLLAVIDLGCGMAVVRDLAAEGGAPDRRVLVATLLSSRAIAALTFSLAIFGLSTLAGPVWQDAIRVGAPALAAWTLFLASSDVLRGHERHGAVAVGNALRTTVFGATTLWLVVFEGKGLVGLVTAIAAAYGAGLVCLLWFLALRTSFGRPSVAVYLRLLRFGLPAGAYLLTRMAWGLDRYVIRYRSSLADAGYFQLASAPTGAIEALESVWILSAEPFIYGVPAASRGAALERLVRNACMMLGGVAVLLSLFGPEILLVVAPRSYAPALAALPWLTFAAVARGVAYLVGFGAGAARQTRAWAVTGALELVLAAVGLFAVLPWGGLAGAGAVRLAAALAALPVCYFMVRRLSPIELPVVRISTLLVLASVLSSVIATNSFGMLMPVWVRAGVAVALLALGWLGIAPPRSRAV
jgi:O-antigen/teichoic acid export membrane protein